MKQENTIFDYPSHLLDPKYIQPAKMRKTELATLLKRSWKSIRREIDRSPELKQLLELTHYRQENKVLYPEHVAVFFSYFMAPLRSAENETLYRFIQREELRELEGELKKMGLTYAA